MNASGERARSRLPVAPLGVTGVALGLRLLTAGHGIVTVDEPTWLARSEHFSRALASWSPSDASLPIDGMARTRPGVTTMWIGSAARVLGLGARHVGLTHESLTPFSRSDVGLRIAQVLMALVCSVLIGLITVLASRVLGSRAGIAVGVLLATEPFVIAHTTVLHTDGLVALPLISSTFALLIALRLCVGDESGREVRARWAAVAGSLAGLAVLTKVSAALFLPGLAVAVVAFVARAPTRTSALAALKVIAVVSGSLIATMFVLWPALWVHPIDQVRAMIDSARLGEAAHTTYFRGRPTSHPGPTYYLVAVPLRASPMLLVGALAAPVTTLIRRARVRAVSVMALAPLPFLVALSAAHKQFDRYGLPIIGFGAVLAAVAFDDVVELIRPIWQRWSTRRFSHLRQRWLHTGATAALVVLVSFPAIAISPYPLAYFDPMLGGGRRGRATLLTGWGEGLEQFGQRIDRERRGDCDGVVVAVPVITASIAFPCGAVVPLAAPRSEARLSIDYAVIYVFDVQRHYRDRFFALVRSHGTRVMSLRIAGIDYGELWQIDHAGP